MKRYQAMPGAELYQSGYGMWITYDDHMDEIKKLNARIEELENRKPYTVECRCEGDYGPFG